MSEVDAICADICGINESPDLDEAGVPDVVGEFLAASQLSCAVRKNGFAEALAESTAGLDQNFAAAMRKTRTAPGFSKNAANDWDEHITDPATLSKRHAAGIGSPMNHAWITNRMALGKSASEVIDEWCEEFPHRRPEIEQELRAIAAELDRAA